MCTISRIHGVRRTHSENLLYGTANLGFGHSKSVERSIIALHLHECTTTRPRCTKHTEDKVQERLANMFSFVRYRFFFWLIFGLSFGRCNGKELIGMHLGNRERERETEHCPCNFVVDGGNDKVHLDAEFS